MLGMNFRKECGSSPKLRNMLTPHISYTREWQALFKLLLISLSKEKGTLILSFSTIINDCVPNKSILLLFSFLQTFVTDSKNF